MNLKEIARELKLNARMTGKPQKQQLPRGLWVMALPDGGVKLARKNVAPSELEISIAARSFDIQAWQAAPSQKGSFHIIELVPMGQKELF